MKNMAFYPGSVDPHKEENTHVSCSLRDEIFLTLGGGLVAVEKNFENYSVGVSMGE